jgi:hypothetical protein
MHLYWCADCKTPGCNETQILKYIGPSKEWAGVSVSMALPAFLGVRCSKCNSVQEYTRKDLRQIELPFAPPPYESIQ